MAFVHGITSIARRSDPRLDRAQTGQPGSSALTFVIADKRVDWQKVDCGDEMNSVQSPKHGFLKRACCGEKRTVNWQQSHGIQDFAGARQKRLGRK